MSLNRYIRNSRTNRMKLFSIFLLSGLFLFSCQSSTELDLTTGNGIKFTSQGLSCKEVQIDVNGKKTGLSEYKYGDKITLNFVNVDGLKRIDGKVYPGMKLFVANLKGDTMLFMPDMYAESDGIKFDPVTLLAEIIAANPIFSGEKCIAHIDFWDKKGTGKLHAEFKFSTKKNDLISVNAKTLNYKEIYIFSEKNQTVVSDNMYDKTDKLYFIIEGLEGFKLQDGLVFPCCMLEVKNKQGEVILKEENLLKDYYDSGINFEAVKEKIFFSLNDVALMSSKELSIHTVILDKLSDAALIIDTRVRAKN